MPRSVAARIAATALLLLVPVVVATCRLDDLLGSMKDVVIAVGVAPDTLAVADSVEVIPQVTVDGEPREGIPLVWSSSELDVATVNERGRVHGVGRGKAVLTVRIPPGAIIENEVVASDTVWVIAASVGVAPADTTLAAPGDTLCVRGAAFDAAGDTIPTSTPVLSIASDPDSTIRQVEATSCVVARANGAPATLRVALDTATADAQVHVVIPRPPDPATGLAQFRSDSITAIDVGASIDETTVIFRGQLRDPDAADQLRLEVELKRLGTDFDGTGTVVGAAVANGGTASVTISAIPDDANYHWRARAVDQTGRTSAVWTSFGDNPESQADFHVPSLPEDPNAPTELAQYQSDGETPIPPGDLAHQASVVLEGRVTDPDPGDQLTLEVEVQPVGTPFADAATATSATHQSGDVASVGVSGLSENTEYRWQARTVDQTGAASPWTPFGQAQSAAADFRVAAPTSPNAPDQLSQTVSDGSAITVGATIDERTVVFKATVSDPDPGDQIRLEVETKPVGEEFDGNGTFESAPVGSETVASVTVTDQADDTDYHWRVRAVDQSGLASGWVAFGGNADSPPPAETDYGIAAIPDPPELPTGLAQFASDGTTPLDLGATTNDPTVVFSATVTDPDPAGTIRLEVEAKPVGTAFDGTNTNIGSVGVAPEGTAQVTATLADNTSYHWRARARDETDLVSGWVNFPEGGNPETEPDFTVDAGPDPPLDPTGLEQVKTDGLTAIAPGGTTNENAVIFRGIVSDPDPGAEIRLEVEVKPIDVAFDGTGTDMSAAVPSGETAGLTIGNQADLTDYHWRARALDEDDNASGWVGFGSNPENPPDNPADIDYRVQVRDPPEPPSALTQLDGGLTTLNQGDTTDQSTVVFRATVTDSDPADATLRLEVEVKPVTVALDGTGTDTSAAVNNGTTAEVTIDALGDDTDYHWRARTVADDTRASEWVSFGSNLDGETDFRVAVPENPFAPADTALRQLPSGDSGIIAVGDTSRTDTVVLRARLADPDAGDSVRLDVEWQRVGTEFTNTARASSGFVAGGDTAVAQATGLTDDDAYHWRARAVDQTGRESPWTAFGGNADPDGVDFRVWIPENPALPTAPTQLKSNGSTTIPTGGVTDETTVIFRAGVGDPDPGDSVRIQIERRTVETAFNGTPTHDGTLVASGEVSTVTVATHNDNAGYHWQVRALDKNGNRSQWVPFGGNSDGNPPGTPADPDYYVNSVPQDPSPPPTNAKQYQSDGTTEIPVGGFAGGSLSLDATVIFKAQVFDPDPGDSLVIQIEVRLVGDPFTGDPTHTGAARVGSDGTAELTATFARPALAGTDDYHWQVRTLDQTGRWSDWVPFGGNDESEPDFRVQSTLGL